MESGTAPLRGQGRAAAPSPRPRRTCEHDAGTMRRPLGLIPRRPWSRPKGRARESRLRLGRVRAAPSSVGSSAMAAIARRRRSNFLPVGPRARGAPSPPSLRRAAGREGGGGGLRWFPLFLSRALIFHFTQVCGAPPGFLAEGRLRNGASPVAGAGAAPGGLCRRTRGSR